MNIQEVCEKWEKTGLLNGLVERREVMASCLQAQIEFNEECGDSIPVEWRRSSIPVVRRVFGETSMVFKNDFSDEHAGNTSFYMFKQTWNPPMSGDLNEEAEYVASFSAMILKELNENFHDFRRQINFYGISANDNDNGQVVLYYV